MTPNISADPAANVANPSVFDATTAGFETDVLQRSMEIPVLVDFWADWCGPCKTLGPVLEKVAAEFNGGFLLAKVDTEKEPQIAEAFQIRSIPTVFLVKGGQIVDAFQGAVTEAQVREFLTRHGIEAAANEDATTEQEQRDPQAEVERLRAAIAATPDKPELTLDLALALLQIGGVQEAGQLLEALPANLSTDDRAIKARARLGFATLLKDAPPLEALETAIESNADDMHARHLLGVHRIVAGDNEAGLQQFIEMLQRDRDYQDGLPRKVLIDAFRVIDDVELVGRYRRRMSSLILI